MSLKNCMGTQLATLRMGAIRDRSPYSTVLVIFKAGPPPTQTGGTSGGSTSMGEPYKRERGEAWRALRSLRRKREKNSKLKKNESGLWGINISGLSLVYAPDAWYRSAQLGLKERGEILLNIRRRIIWSSFM